MTQAVLVDLVLVLVLVAHAAAMYRVGLLTGAASIVGLLGGGLLALWGLPRLLDHWDATAEAPLLRSLALLLGVAVVAGIGQHLGGRLGLRARGLVRVRVARTIDSILGAVGALAAGGVLVWLVAGAVVAASPTTPEPVAGSRVIQGIDRVMPARADAAISSVYRSLGSDGFPRVFTGVRPEVIRPVDPPTPGITQGRGIDAVASSIVQVVGQAECGRGQTGSGWVAAPERVVTNAHVVAGVDHPSVRVGGTGRPHDASVVAFDPRRDVAVLAVPGLDAAALPTGDAQEHGDEVAVAGFPLGGPYDVEPGRVRERLTARGAGVDGRVGAVRDIYSVNVRVEQGNSGGPMLSPTGQVVGTVFAKSPSDSRTGYVLTLDETRPVIDAAAGATAAVPTGSCAA